MTRTQMLLPDETLARAKTVCQEREISLAELARRGLEYILSIDAPATDANREWQPPRPRKLGWKGLSDAGLKIEARRTNTALSGTQRRRNPEGRNCVTTGDTFRKHFTRTPANSAGLNFNTSPVAVSFKPIAFQT